MTRPYPRRGVKRPTHTLLLNTKIQNTKIQKHSKRYMTLALCLTPAVGMTNGNFLQTSIKNSLLYTKTVEILANSHTVPHHASIN